MKKVLFAICFAFLLLIMSSFINNKPLPDGWFKAGSEPDKYEMTLDHINFKAGKSAATIKSTKTKIKGFGTMMQSCSAKKYLGKRIKLSGYMKSENVEDWAGFWLRIDGSEKGKSLGFDNMQDRAIEGTTDWNYYEIILDVPSNSYSLNFGALLSGTGQIWFDELSIEVVENNTPTSGSSFLEKPTNLGME